MSGDGKIKVLAGSPCGKIPVYGRFHDCFAELDLPEGSERIRVAGGSIPLNLNKLVDEAQKGEFSHLFIIEDDTEFHRDTVNRLLNHNKPIVAGIVRTRFYPFHPYIYKGYDETGVKFYKIGEDERGLIGGEGFATGLSGVLIDLKVFDELSKPYFNHYFIGEKEWGQDIVFAQEIMKKNIPAFVDLNVNIGHMTQSIIGSKVDQGGLRTTIRITGMELVVP